MRSPLAIMLFSCCSSGLRFCRMGTVARNPSRPWPVTAPRFPPHFKSQELTVAAEVIPRRLFISAGVLRTTQSAAARRVRPARCRYSIIAASLPLMFSIAGESGLRCRVLAGNSIRDGLAPADRAASSQNNRWMGCDSIPWSRKKSTMRASPASAMSRSTSEGLSPSARRLLCCASSARMSAARACSTVFDEYCLARAWRLFLGTSNQNITIRRVTRLRNIAVADVRRTSKSGHTPVSFQYPLSRIMRGQR